MIEEQRKKAKSAERRKTILVIALSSLVGLGLIGSSVYFSLKSKKESNAALATLGVAPDAAGCTDPVEETVNDAVNKESKHVNGSVDYAKLPTPFTNVSVPPIYGPHAGNTLPGFGQNFYSRDANPPPERAVHNLEHGYIVVWYDKAAPEDQVKLLEDAADAESTKFLVVPWTRDDFPEDKHIVLTAWGTRQRCSAVSGQVIADFIAKYRGVAGRAPEKNVG